MTQPNDDQNLPPRPPVPPQSGQPGQQLPQPQQGHQPGQPQSQPTTGNPYPSQPTAGQSYPGQSSVGQPYSSQPSAGQPYPAQPYSGQPYPGQSAPGQPYPGQPNTGPASFAGASSSSETPRKKRRRGPIIAILSAVVVIILIVVGGIVGLSIGNAAHAPENKVTAYLDALVKGDASEALKLSGVEVDAEADLLLDDKVYAEVADRPSAYEIGRTTTSGDTATVTATLTQGGNDVTEEFTLTKDGKDAVFFDNWVLDEVPLGSIAVGMTGPSAVRPAIDGIEIPEGTESLRALPGTYDVGLSGENEFFSVEEQTLTVEGFSGSAASPSADLTVALTDAGTQKANDAVNAWLDACQASTEFDPAGCSFYATGKNPDYTYTNTKWTLDPRPTFTIGDWNGTGYRVATDASGQANLTADIRDNASGATGTATAGPIPVYVNGDITEITADGATFVSAITRG